MMRAIGTRSAVLSGGAALVAAAVIAGVFSTSRSQDVVVTNTEVSHAVSEAPIEAVDYPEDGWYLYLSVLPGEGSQAEQIKKGQAIVDALQLLGYKGVSLQPHPGVPRVCLGLPCLAVGLPPGFEYAVIVEQLPGPDFTSAETRPEDIVAFMDAGVSSPAFRKLGTLGLDALPSLHWLPFSVYETVKPFTPPTPEELRELEGIRP